MRRIHFDSFGGLGGVNVDRPSRVFLVIDGMFHWITWLTMICPGPFKTPFFTTGFQRKIRQYEVAVSGSARSVGRKTGIRQCSQANCSDRDPFFGLFWLLKRNRKRIIRLRIGF